MIPLYRVSNLNAYARWKEDESQELSWLYESIFSSQQTEAMARGTAFHKALEQVGSGEFDTVAANGYNFTFSCDAEVALPKTREFRMFKDYGGIIVTGQCDGIAGRQIDDHKTVSQFDAEHQLEGWQHRFYLDIFDADVFRWHCWLTRERGPYEYDVTEYHMLTQYRYPELQDDCAKLALEFKDFAASQGWNGIGRVA